MRGFGGKYFSLAAILASVSAMTLAAQASQIEQIHKVVVTADKSEEDLESATEDIEVLSAEELEEKGIETLPDLMRYITGSEVVQNGGAGKAASIYLRGLGNDKVLVLIDGVRFNDPSNFNGPQSEHLRLLGVERVEIVRGAQSGVWGSDAAAGVINIITSKQPHANASFSLGSFDTREFRASVASSVDKLFYGLDFGFLDTRGFSAITPFGQDPRDFERDGYTNRSLKGHLGYRLDRGFVELGGIYINAYNEGDGYNPTTYAPDPDSKNDDKFRYYATYANGGYILGQHTLSLHLDSTKTRRNFLDTTWGVNYFEGRTKNAELRDLFAYGAGTAQIGVGYQRFESLYDDTSGKHGDESYDNPYGFVTNKNRFGDLVVSENLRYDSYSDFDDQWTGKVGLRYEWGKVAFLANYGTAYNVPNQIKRINPWGKPNPNLQPEKTRSYDLGLQGYGLKVVWFEEHIKDLIDWYDPDPNVFGDEQYINMPGTSKFKGVELRYQRALSDELLMGVGFTYLSPKDAKGNELLRRARRKYDYSVTWYPTEEHTITLSGYYIGSRYDIGGVQTGKYNVTNLSASHHFAPHFKGFVRIQNLFDRYYQEVYGYGSEPRSVYVGIEGSF